MIQLNPNKRRKNKEKEERENETKKNNLRIVPPGETWKRFKGDVGKVWKGTKNTVKRIDKWNKENTITIPTHASNKAKNAAKKAEEDKPKKSTAKSRARAANVALHGKKAISGLEAKNKDFQKMKKGGLSKADFIKKYPNSNLAKKSRR